MKAPMVIKISLGYRPWLWILLVTLSASCLSIAPSPSNKVEPLPTTTSQVSAGDINVTAGPPPPGGWEPLDIPTTLRLSSEDFRSNFETRNRIPNPAIPRSSKRGPTLTLEVSGFRPPEAISQQDFATYTSHVRQVEELLQEGLSLTRVSDGQSTPVDIEVRPGWFDLQGRGPDPEFRVQPGYSVVPKNQLREGWYVFRADLSKALQLGIYRPQLEGARINDVLHARIYVGSRPMWWNLFVQCRRFKAEGTEESSKMPICGFVFELTEVIDPATFEEGSKSIRVRYDNQDISCVLNEKSSPSGENSVRVECPQPKLGTKIEAILSSPTIADPLGNIATPVNFVFDMKTFRNVSNEPDPILEARISPFEDFGLK